MHFSMITIHRFLVIKSITLVFHLHTCTCRIFWNGATLQCRLLPFPYLPALVTIISVPSSSNSSHKDFISRCALTFSSLGCRGFLDSPPLSSGDPSGQLSPDLHVWSPFKKFESSECLTQFSEFSPWVLEITSWYSYLAES